MENKYNFTSGGKPLSSGGGGGRLTKDIDLIRQVEKVTKHGSRTNSELDLIRRVDFITRHRQNLDALRREGVPPARRVPTIKSTRKWMNLTAKLLEDDQWQLQRSYRPPGTVPMPAPIGFSTQCVKPDAVCGPSPTANRWGTFGASGPTLANTVCAGANCANYGVLGATDAQFYAATNTGVRAIFHGREYSVIAGENPNEVFTSPVGRTLPATWRRPFPALKAEPPPALGPGPQGGTSGGGGASGEWGDAAPSPKTRIEREEPEEKEPLKYRVPAIETKVVPRRDGGMDIKPPIKTTHRLVPSREKKARWKVAVGRAIKIYHSATEMKDFFQALADSMDHRPCSGLPGFAMAACVIANWDLIDPIQAAKNLVANEIEDQAVARFIGRLGTNLQSVGGPNTTQVTGTLRTVRNVMKDVKPR